MMRQVFRGTKALKHFHPRLISTNAEALNVTSRLLKPDLHVHIDGCVRPQTVWELAKEQNIPLEFDSVEDLAGVLTSPDDCPDLETFLRPYNIVGRFN